MTQMDFTIAVLQFEPLRKNTKKNINTIEALLDGVSADLIVLPELSNSGYLYENPAELEPFSENNLGDGPFLNALIDLSIKTGGIIITGYAEKDGDQLFNSAVALSREGPKHAALSLFQVPRLSHTQPTWYCRIARMQ